MSALIGLFGNYRTNVDDFTEVAKGLFTDSDSQHIFHDVVNSVLSEKDAIDRGISYGRLAAQTLPSLSVFDLSIDVRLKFESNTAEAFAAVAVVYIGTDSEKDLVFQMTKSDVARIIDHLNSALLRLESAENLMKKALS